MSYVVDESVVHVNDQQSYVCRTNAYNEYMEPMKLSVTLRLARVYPRSHHLTPDPWSYRAVMLVSLHFSATKLQPWSPPLTSPHDDDSVGRMDSVVAQRQGVMKNRDSFFEHSPNLSCRRVPLLRDVANH